MGSSKRTVTTMTSVALLLLAASASAGSDFERSTVTPGKVPERPVLGFPGDPAHSFAVTWRTADRVDLPRAQVAP